MKKIHGLSFKLGVIVLIFLLLVLGCCGILMYHDQMNSYHQQCENDL